MAAGIGGTAVFGALTFLRARDDLASARGDLASARDERAEAEGMLDGAKNTAGSAVEEAARLKKELEEVRAVAKNAQKEVNKTSKKATELEEKLRASLKKSEGAVESDGDVLTLNLVDKVLFKSGKADLTPRGKKVIKKLGVVLKKKAKDKQIFVQGHTDDVPIPRSNKNFNSNWELSAARAISVVEYLQSESKISGRLLGAVAFSQYRPIDKKRKAKNRRIEIVLLPRTIKFVGGKE